MRIFILLIKGWIWLSAYQVVAVGVCTCLLSNTRSSTLLSLQLLCFFHLSSFFGFMRTMFYDSYGEEEFDQLFLLPRIETRNFAQNGTALQCCWKQALGVFSLKRHSLQKVTNSLCWAWWDYRTALHFGSFDQSFHSDWVCRLGIMFCASVCNSGCFGCSQVVVMRNRSVRWLYVIILNLRSYLRGYVLICKPTWYKCEHLHQHLLVHVFL